MLPSLPPQPDGVDWPTDEWPVAPQPHPEAQRLVDAALAPRAPSAVTSAMVVVQGGRIVAEGYGDGVEERTTLISWSMAKSVLHAVVGMLVADGVLQLDEPAPVPEWADPHDPRSAITVRHLLAMRDGLDFAEVYDDESTSDVIPMLFGAQRADSAAFAASRPLLHSPGEVMHYSSGTSNILSRITADQLGRHGDTYLAWLNERLLAPLGMRSAAPKCDETGTFVASSFVYASARDFARFGLLYLRDGVWAGRRLLPEGWVDTARTATGRDDARHPGRAYGLHWWIPDRDPATFYAGGFQGQRILVVPALDAVVVRLGATPAERADHVNELVHGVADALASA